VPDDARRVLRVGISVGRSERRFLLFPRRLEVAP
jgi:hypothetical protein